VVPAVAVEIVVVLLLIVFNGILAMSEMAIVSSRRIRLEQQAASGSAGARAALELVDEPNRFLSTVQIGITMVGVLAGAFGGATLSHYLAAVLDDLPFVERYSRTLGFVLVVAAITYLSLVVGELVPKRLALRQPERIAALIARPMQRLSVIATPAVAFLGVSTDALLRLLRAREVEEPPVTEEEIRLMIDHGRVAGVIEEREQELVSGVFALADRQIGSAMTPRPDIVYLDLNDDPEEHRQRMVESRYAFYPVTRGGLDHLLGLAPVRELWSRYLSGEEADLTDVLVEPIYLPESMTLLAAMEEFKRTGVHRALVVDEDGVIQGLLTMNDILEAVVGDIQPVGEAGDAEAVERDDGSWLLDGTLPVESARELLGPDAFPIAEAEHYSTVGGFVMMRLGRIPRAAESFDWSGLRFEVVDMDGNRVDKVLVEPLRPRTDDLAPAVADGTAAGR
jgi:putative hemolysin